MKVVRKLIKVALVNTKQLKSATMPSLSTNNRLIQGKISTFDHFMVDYAPQFEPLQLSLLIVYLAKVTLIVIFCCGERMIADMLYFTYTSVYTNWKIWFIDGAFYHMIGVFIFYSYLLVYLSGVYHTQLNRCETRIYKIICISIYIILNGTLYVWIDLLDLQTANLFRILGIKKSTAAWIDSYLFDVTHVILYVFMPGVMPIIHISMMICYECIQTVALRKKLNNLKSGDRLSLAVSLLTARQPLLEQSPQPLEMSQMTHVQSIDAGPLASAANNDGYRVSNDNNNKNSNNHNNNASDRDSWNYFEVNYEIHSLYVGILFYYLLFVVVWTIYIIVFALLINTIFTQIASYWLYWFYCWMLSTSTAKFLLKHLAKRIDRKRILILEIKNQNKVNINTKKAGYKVLHVHLLISLEWFVEIFFNLIYFCTYRNFLIVHLIGHLAFADLTKGLAVHFATEFYQTGIKLSREYFIYTKYFQDKLAEKSQNVQQKQMKFVLECLVSAFNDDSNLLQWQNRLSIDMMIRLSAASSSLIWFILWLIVGWKAYYNVKVEQLPSIVIYVIISFLIDFVYFVVVMVLHEKYSHINLMQAFVDVSKRYKQGFAIAWIACALMFNTLL